MLRLILLVDMSDELFVGQRVRARGHHLVKRGSLVPQLDGDRDFAWSLHTLKIVQTIVLFFTIFIQGSSRILQGIMLVWLGGRLNHAIELCLDKLTGLLSCGLACDQICWLYFIGGWKCRVAFFMAMHGCLWRARCLC